MQPPQRAIAVRKDFPQGESPSISPVRMCSQQASPWLEPACLYEPQAQTLQQELSQCQQQEQQRDLATFGETNGYTSSNANLDGDVDDDTLREFMQEQEIFRQQMMIEAAGGMDPEELKEHVPRDVHGHLTSIGSLGHATGNCKVCIFAHTKSGCSNAAACGFCHFPHKRARRKNKMRPCKGKRDRLLKFLARVQGMIELDPLSFRLDELELPPSIASNEVIRARLVAKVASYAEQAKVDRLRNSHGDIA